MYKLHELECYICIMERFLLHYYEDQSKFNCCTISVVQFILMEILTYFETLSVTKKQPIEYSMINMFNTWHPIWACTSQKVLFCKNQIFVRNIILHILGLHLQFYWKPFCFGTEYEIEKVFSYLKSSPVAPKYLIFYLLISDMVVKSGQKYKKSNFVPI